MQDLVTEKKNVGEEEEEAEEESKAKKKVKQSNDMAYKSDNIPCRSFCVLFTLSNLLAIINDSQGPA